ncbi:MAG TPA: hypothetical protein VHX16_02255 [Chloroflexota bacterium]|jgi:hypothetical protein|nr:hypothetical protein [Chloroflexota bacterium]
MTQDDSTRPLGVRPDVSLTPEQARTLQALERYDLSPVRQRLLRDGTLPEAWLDEALVEFRRYLGLRALADGPLIMFSDHIDHVWHTCIIFTRLYADLCQQAFGTFVHHEPTMEDDPDRHRKIEAVQELYQAIYGPMSYVWGTGHNRGCA